MFFQPELERAIDRHACGLAERDRRARMGSRGCSTADECVELALRRVEEKEAGRLALTGEARTVSARWLVGADGANSFVREATGITRRDLGFQERWLVVDAEPHDMAALAHLPIASQWCDPSARRRSCRAAPATGAGSSCCCPASSRADFEDPERVWSLLEPWYTPEDGPLTRSAVYEFRSMLANQMRKGQRAAGRRRRPPDPAVPGAGPVLGPARRRQRRVEARPRSARPRAADRCSTAIDPERQPQNEAIIASRRRAREGPLPARPERGGRARRDAAPGRSAAAARARAAQRRRRSTVGGRGRSARRQLSVQGVVRACRARGALRRCRRPGLSADRRDGDPLDALDASSAR